jgi:hypothetical protein
MENKKVVLVEKLKKIDPTHLNMVIGLDGFVDEIIHVVDKRSDFDHFSRIDTIQKLADRIAKASGLSTNIELIPVQKKIGGNGPIMCNALAMHNPTISYIGSLGYPDIDPVFKEMEKKVTLYSMANPGHTDALEFHDGKLMLGKMESLKDVFYENLIEVVGFERLDNLLSNADLFATVNWSMIPKMTDLWKKLVKHVLPNLAPRVDKPIFFVDLADPEKRENNDIIEALNVLKSFKSYYKVVLGLNEKEAVDVAKVLEVYDVPEGITKSDKLKGLSQALYQYLEIDAIVIHPVEMSAILIDGKYYEANGPYVQRPKLTTGAGDNFNAGLVTGLLLGLEPDEALLFGMATSGYYVRNAHSPNYQELISFIESWNVGLI